MRKLLISGVVLAGAVILMRRIVPRVDWEQRIAAMPDNAPPKWMFNNISAIRENTDEILRLLARE